jgi:hypothetical protein
MKKQFGFFMREGDECVHVANPVAFTRTKAMSMDTVKRTLNPKRHGGALSNFYN